MSRHPFHTNGELAAMHTTGLVRGRLTWFGKVIMQLQVRAPMPRYPNPPPPPGSGPDAHDPWRNGAYLFWRDATADDLNNAFWTAQVLKSEGTR